jgi:beta-xylosidase
VWQANADPDWWSLRRRPGRLSLTCRPSADHGDLRLLGNVLGQRFPAESFSVTTAMTLATTAPDARAGLVVLGATYAWIGLRHDGDGLVLVCRTAATDAAEVDAAPPVPLGGDRGSVRLRVSVGPGGSCQFAAAVNGRDLVPVGAPFAATPGRWIGATVGLFATAPATTGRPGVAEFDRFGVAPSG